jgi:hypothetical protein
VGPVKNCGGKSQCFTEGILCLQKNWSEWKVWCVGGKEIRGKEKCGVCLRNFDHGSLQIENPVIQNLKDFWAYYKNKKC